MKISAVTICINYSDYLSCCLANRRHFDRWIIVTVADDKRTQAFCEEHDLECIVSRKLKPFRRPFDAACNKAALINEGLDALKQEGWSCVLDADTLLPPDFLSVVKQSRLKKGFLYGVMGRRICWRECEFDYLSRSGPWLANLERREFILGYFNLFSLEAHPNRYPRSARGISRPRESMEYDDIRFYSQFGESRSRLLPIGALHVGQIGSNWSGRQSSLFSMSRRLKSASQDSSPPHALAGFVSERLRGNVALLLGLYSGELSEALASNFKRVYVFDAWRMLGGDSERGILPNAFTISEWKRVQSKHANLHLVPSPQTGEPVDAVVFGGELDEADLSNVVEKTVSPKSAPTTICGSNYTVTGSKKWTLLVKMVFGIPALIQLARKTWMTSVRLPLSASDSTTLKPGSLVVPIGSDLELSDAALTLECLRQFWKGDLALLWLGESSEAVALFRIARLMGVRIVRTPAIKANVTNFGAADKPMCESLSAFRGILGVVPGALPDAALVSEAMRRGSHGFTLLSKTGAIKVFSSAWVDTIEPDIGELIPANDKRKLELRCISSLAVTVDVPRETEIFVLAHVDSLKVLERWLAGTRFESQRPIHVLTSSRSIARRLAHLDIPGYPNGTLIVHPMKSLRCVRTVLCSISEISNARNALALSTVLMPNPGCSTFCEGLSDRNVLLSNGFHYALCKGSKSQSGGHSVMRMPYLDLCFALRVPFVRTFLDRCNGTNSRIEHLLTQAMAEQRVGWQSFSPSDYGWEVH